MNSINNYLYRRFIIFLFILPVFIILGFMNLSLEIFPSFIEIQHFEKKAQATIGHKLIHSNFTKHSVLIPNVKEAKMIKGLNSGGKKAFKIVLEDSNGEQYSVTPYFLPKHYASKQLLLKQIDFAIKNNTDFYFEIIEEESIYFSIILIVIPSIILFFWILYKLKMSKKETRIPEKTHKKTEEEIYFENNPISDEELERQALEAENPVELPKKQYNNINDSIIK